jgi:hypothetical protein
MQRIQRFATVSLQDAAANKQANEVGFSVVIAMDFRPGGSVPAGDFCVT